MEIVSDNLHLKQVGSDSKVPLYHVDTNIQITDNVA